MSHVRFRDYSSCCHRCRSGSPELNLGLACAQAATLCSQVVGHSHRRSARATLNDPGRSRRPGPRKYAPLYSSVSVSIGGSHISVCLFCFRSCVPSLRFLSPTPFLPSRSVIQTHVVSEQRGGLDPVDGERSASNPICPHVPQPFLPTLSAAPPPPRHFIRGLWRRRARCALSW